MDRLEVPEKMRRHTSADPPTCRDVQARSPQAPRKITLSGATMHTPPSNRKHAYMFNYVPRSIVNVKAGDFDDEEEEDPQRIRRMRGISVEVDIAKKSSKLWLL